MAGEAGRVPADRPIDGIDSADLLLGSSDKSNRDHVLFYGSDGGIMSVKWKTMKVVFRYSESTSGPIIKPQWPLIFDLIDDPNEEWDLMEKRLDCGWVIAPVAQRLSALQQSAARYPNIKPGEEFAGYRR
jgi:arylsulfatase